MPDFLEGYIPEGEAAQRLKFETESDFGDDEPGETSNSPVPGGGGVGVANDDTWGGGEAATDGWGADEAATDGWRADEAVTDGWGADDAAMISVW